MNKTLVAGTVACWLLVAFAVPLGAGEYRVVDLNPPGKSASLFTATSDGRYAAGHVITHLPGGGIPMEAAVWDLTDGSHVILSPGSRSADVSGIAGGQQVGSRDDGDRFPVEGSHAMLWRGPGNTVDLHIPFTSSSEAFDTNGSAQVGYATFGPLFEGARHAILWRGSSNNYVDLTPLHAGYRSAVAFGIDGDRQVGYASPNDAGGDSHAMIWRGSAGSFVSLHPGPHVRGSAARGIRGNEQVGTLGYVGGPAFAVRAALWHDTPESFVDLTPLGSLRAEALATNGRQQVGSVIPAGLDRRHAVVWSGTADSVLDLHQLLPNPERFLESTAYDIDDAGNVYGTALEAVGSGTAFHAIVWRVVPEPSPLGLLAVGAASLLGRRRGCCAGGGVSRRRAT